MANKAIAQYIKRIKFNMVVCDISGTPTGLPYESGGYIRVDQFYSEQFIADTSNILYESNGDLKIIAYDDMANITYQQMYVSEDKQKILFFAEPLIQSSECDSKARRFVDINEQFFVQTSEGSGEYEPYLVDDGTGTKVPFMVLKEGVVVIE